MVVLTYIDKNYKFKLNVKTRLFVTNSLSFLSQVDEILMIENGEIVQKGTYKELKNQDGLFSYFTKNFLEKISTQTPIGI